MRLHSARLCLNGTLSRFTSLAQSRRKPSSSFFRGPNEVGVPSSRYVRQASFLCTYVHHHVMHPKHTAVFRASLFPTSLPFSLETLIRTDFKPISMCPLGRVFWDALLGKGGRSSLVASCSDPPVGINSDVRDGEERGGIATIAVSCMCRELIHIKVQLKQKPCVVPGNGKRRDRRLPGMNGGLRAVGG